MIISLPLDLPLSVSIADAVGQDLLYHIGVVFWDLAMRSVVVKGDLGSVHLRQVHLETICMNIDNVVLYGHLVSSAIPDSVQDLTRAGPQGIKLVAFMG